MIEFQGQFEKYLNENSKLDERRTRNWNIQIYKNKSVKSFEKIFPSSLIFNFKMTDVQIDFSLSWLLHWTTYLQILFSQ